MNATVSKIRHLYTHTAARILLHVLVLLGLCGLFLYFGFRGIDFGTHWDEHKLIDSVVAAFENGNFLPHWYNYPSISYDLTFFAFTRRVILYSIQNPPHSVQSLLVFWNGLSDNLLGRARTHEFNLTVRKVFVLFSSLSLMWVYWLVYRWRKNIAEAVIAALILLGSWEFMYHSRWIAPDVLMAQFSIATFTCLTFAVTGKRWNLWITLAAIAAGLACATKYPGGLLLLPVLATILLNRRSGRVAWLLKTILVFLVTFYVVSPGVLLELSTSLKQILAEMQHYATGHRGYTVAPGLPHLRLMLIYLFGVATSHNILIAVTLSGFFLFGAYQAFREKFLIGMLMALFMVLYILYFSTQHVMTVRNLMILIPMFAVFTARGIVDLFHDLPGRIPRIVFTILIAGLIFYNLNWQLYAANSIAAGGPDRSLALASYIRHHSDQEFWLSQSAADALKPEDSGGLNNIVANPQQADLLVINSDDISLKSITLWPANFIDLSVETIGEKEINFNYNPSWSGKNHLVIMKPKYALPLLPIIEAPNPN